MSEALKNITGNTVAFGDVVQLSKERSQNPEADGFERYIGLEHLEPGDLKARRWGEISDGVTFTSVFRPGQVLFGKRRAYQRKVAVADFSGVCSGDIYVLEPKGDQLLPDLLPFICQSEPFYDYVISMSQGGLSPRVNWKALAKYGFTLPPLEEQRRIVEVLQAVESAIEAADHASNVSTLSLAAAQKHMVESHHECATTQVRELCRPDAPLCYGVIQPGIDVPDGIPLIRVCDIENDSIEQDELKRISPEIDASYERSRIEEGDLLVSIVGTIGRVYVATNDEEGFNIARAIARIRLREEYRPRFVAAVLKSQAYQRLLVGESFETARKTLNLGALGEIEIPVPTQEAQDHWCQVLDSIEAGRNQIDERIGQLKRLKTSLLNDLGEGSI